MGKYIIDYAHQRKDGFYRATLSNVDEQPRATWTVEKEGKSEEREGVIDQEIFDWLWNGVAESGLFKRYRGRPEDQAVDVVANHVVGIAFEVGEEMGFLTHQVPVGERDLGFSEWLMVLAGTYR